MTTDFGRDWSCVTDLDPNGRTVGGTLLVAQDIARRITTPRGMVIDAPDYGIDVHDYLGDDLTAASIPRIKGEVTAEINKDPRVLSVIVTPTLSIVSGTDATPRQLLTLDIRGTCAAGPFVLVLSVDEVSVELLRAS